MLIRFLIGGLMYMGIEVLYDGTTHRSMGLVGGLAFIVCGAYDELFMLPYWVLCLMIAVTVTMLEYIAGLVFNRDYSIWDYRKIPFNINGQVCLPFMAVWAVVIAPLIIWLDNMIRLIF